MNSAGKVFAAVSALVLLAAASLLLRGAETGRESVKVSGAWALYPLMVRWAEEYQKVNPGVRVDVSAGGAGKGMADVLSGLVDLGMVSREIDASEVEKGAYAVKVAKDAVVPTMNKGNPAAAEVARRGVTRSLLGGVFVYGNVTTWSQVTGKPGTFDRISVYVRSDSCGAAEVWAKYFGVKQEDLRGVGIYGDPGIAEAVSRDAEGIGFNNLNFAYDDKTGLPLGNLMIMPIDLDGDGAVEADESFYSGKRDLMAAIDDGRYPSPPARELYVVAKDNFTGPAKEFMRWVLTDGQKYVEESGYIPLGGNVLSEQAERVG